VIEQVFDPASRKRLLDSGLQSGWHCLEVGPGAGSIMNWMGEVVGSTGRVVAVDLDPKFLREVDRPNVSIVRADIRTAQLSQQSFDVVHARYVLIHLADYEVVLTKMLDCVAWDCRRRGGPRVRAQGQSGDRKDVRDVEDGLRAGLEVARLAATARTTRPHCRERCSALCRQVGYGHGDEDVG
jgi:hypothetical protein